MSFIEQILSVIAPHQCLSCQVDGTLLCGPCATRKLSISTLTCYRCGVAAGQGICGTCRLHSPLQSFGAIAVHDGLARALVHRLKFERASAAAEPIAELMADHIPGRDMVVVHVPTASSRVRKRGYDQAGLIARLVAKRTGLPYEPLLVRMGQQRQLGQSRQARQRQLTGAMRARSTRSTTHNVLLIDDVATTGSSLEEAARALHQAGFKQVHAMVFALAK